MKTYQFSSLHNFKLSSQKLFAKNILSGYEWTIYDDTTQVHDPIIFKDDGSLIETENGIVSQMKWEFVSANNSVIITDNERHSLMFRIIVLNKSIIVMELGTTNTFCFLVNNNDKNDLVNKSLFDLKCYLRRQCSFNIMNDAENQVYLKKFPPHDDPGMGIEPEDVRNLTWRDLLLRIIVGVIILIFFIALISMASH